MYTAIITYRPGNGKSAEEIVASFEAAVPMFSSMPGLIRKYFCFDDEKMEGTSVYIWENRGAAEACYENPMFKERFKASFGCEPSIKYTEVKLVVDNA
jgi:heme-degrading monooxygenase HmoA